MRILCLELRTKICPLHRGRYDFSVKEEITLSIIVAKLGRTSVLGYYL